jgi:hypothetical protein
MWFPQSKKDVLITGPLDKKKGTILAMSLREDNLTSHLVHGGELAGRNVTERGSSSCAEKNYQQIPEMQRATLVSYEE